MCGIVGLYRPGGVRSDLVKGLGRLEYRGYDSAGIAVMSDAGLKVCRAKGSLDNLKQSLDGQIFDGAVGIAHTRWATHGPATKRNAHPHRAGRVAIVHNGIIENEAVLRQQLIQRGTVFRSDTDSEVIAHLINEGIDLGLMPVDAVRRCNGILEGHFAYVAVFDGLTDLLIGTARQCPLCIGLVGDGVYFASDSLAFDDVEGWMLPLEDGELVLCQDGHLDLYNDQAQPVARAFLPCGGHQKALGKDGFDHYMRKEIQEQPVVVDATMAALQDDPEFGKALQMLGQARQVAFIACGTSLYAGQVAAHWFERWADMPADCWVASELRYRDRKLAPDTAAILISQSGETADSLACLRLLKQQGIPTIAIVNVPGSAMAREADCALRSHAGPEIGVASTKAYSCQLAVLSVLALKVAGQSGSLDNAAYDALENAVVNSGTMMAAALARAHNVKPLAQKIAGASSCIYMGRGLNHALAAEGALKLKEISYIHAEDFAAGELKHGPIALLDADMPVVAIAPKDRWFDKTLSNIREVQARSAPVFLITDQDDLTAEDADILTVETAHADLFAFPAAIMLQLLSYEIAILRGTNVDRPRNLAKSVTVE